MTAEPSPGKPAGAPASRANVPSAARARTPEPAFDALYVRAAPTLNQQERPLTGSPALDRHCVRRAFDPAWQRRPEVGRDSDPVGWLRAAAYGYALAPWQRWVPGHGPNPRPGSTPAEPPAAAPLGLPPAHRRAVPLCDGLGLDLPEAAAEIEESTVSTAGRITQARGVLAAAVPELGDGVDEVAGAGAGAENGVPARLGAPHPGEADPEEPPHRPEGVPGAGERAMRRRTVGAFALTGLIAVLTTVTVALGPAYDRGPAAPATHLPPSAETDVPAAPAHAPVPAPAQREGAGPPPAGERARAHR